MEHNLKTLQPYYGLVSIGVKKFEIRKNDRDFQIGDTLILQEYINGALTGSTIKKTVLYVLKDCPEYGLKDGFALLSIA